MHNAKDINQNSLGNRDTALRAMTRQQFADYRTSDLTYIRQLTSQQLEALLPDVDEMPKAASYFVLLAANGVPLMVSDDRNAIDDWLGEHEAEMALLH